MGNKYIVLNNTAYGKTGDEVDDAVVSISALRTLGVSLCPTNTALSARAVTAVAARANAAARAGLSVEPAVPAQAITPSYRRSGQATISAAALTAAVVLTPAEPDTNFQLDYAIVTHTDATPVAGSTNVFVPDKAVGGFTLTLDAAPGGSDVVTIDWVITRP